MLTWAGIGALLTGLGARAQSWAVPLAVLLGTALLVVEARGLALVLASLGALTILVVSLRALGPRLPWLGAVVAIPAAFASLAARDALPPFAVARPPAPARAAGPTILLLTVDTLRADAAGPTFQALARRGLSGPAWSTAPWTLPALASLHTGRTPYEHGALVRAPLAGQTRIAGLASTVGPTLAEALRAAGWRTGAFVENPQVTRARGFGRGFSVWDSPDDRDAPRSMLLDPFGVDLAGEPLVVRGRDPSARVDRALAWLAEQAVPTFLWVHLLGPHLPYLNADLGPGTALGDALGPGQATRLNLDFLRRGSLRWTPALRAEVRTAYANEAARSDAALARLVAAAGPDAVIVYAADHGEELGEHGGWEHGHALWEEVVRVPLAMAGPGVPAATFGGPASLVDVAPTLLALAGVSGGSGIDLRAIPADRTLVLADTLYLEEREGLVRWPWKLTRTLSGDDVRLVDLDADPGELVNRSSTDPDALTTLSGALDAERARLGDTPTGTIGEELRALGYVE
ncbi:MAG: sulfatase-like hydrolase/transferase [Pseudomonadota bacterium]|nr:sulfatase-like hydrolase/transferase [Pseudomonadota bacterium]